MQILYVSGNPAEYMYIGTYLLSPTMTTYMRKNHLKDTNWNQSPSLSQEDNKANMQITNILFLKYSLGAK
jgi:hypothetical protein